MCEERLQDIMKQSASTTLTHKDFSDGHMERLVSCHAVHQIVFSLWKLIASPDEQQKLISKWMGTLQPIQTNGITVHSNCAVLAQLIAELVGTSRRRSKKARVRKGMVVSYLHVSHICGELLLDWFVLARALSSDACGHVQAVSGGHF